MQILKLIFSPFVAIFKFINTYFKTSVFLFIVALVLFSGDKVSNPNLTQISLNGAIVDEKMVLDQIYEAMDDESIKGVLFDVDSPGGALAPSIAISDALLELKAKKPVLAYASGTMASGSYYASIWADKIYANRGSFIGSIGVIMQGANIEELANKIGIKTQTIKAGEFKEAGAFYRAWSKAEKDELQNLVNKSYELFCTDVAKARKLNLKDVDIWANARVFLANDALKLGLIDGIKSYRDAKKELEILSGVENPIWKERPMFDRFISNFTKESANLMFKIFFGNEVR